MFASELLLDKVMELRADTVFGSFVVKISALFLVCAVGVAKLYGTSSIEEIQAGVTGYLCPLITYQGDDCPAWNSAPPRTVWQVFVRSLTCLLR